MRPALLLILLFIALGCGKQRSLVGEWSTRADAGSGSIMFRDDCTFRSYTEAAMASLVLDGTYEYKGENLRMHVVSWSVPKGPPLSEQDRKAMNKAFQTDARSTVTWTDENHVRLAGAGNELTTAERVSK